MKNKAIAYNIIGNIIVYFCTLLVNFLLSPYIVGTLGVDAYGYVQLANNFVGYITIVTVALTSMAGRFVSIPLFRKDYETANKYYNSVFYATQILSLVLCAVSAVVVIFLDDIFVIPNELSSDIKLLFALVFGAFIVGLSLTVYSVGLFIENKIYLRAKRNIESSIIRAVALFAMYYLLDAKLYYIGLSGLFVNLYMSLWNLYYTRKYVPELKLSIKKFDFGAVIEIVRSGFWNSLSQVSAVLNEGLALIITNLFIGSAEMGILSLAKMVPNTLMSLLSNLGEPFMPKMTEAYANGNKEEIKNIVNSGAKVMGFMMSIPIAGFVVFGDIFFMLWQPTQDPRLLHALSTISILNLILSCSTATIYGVFTIANKLKLNSIIGVVIGFINCGIVFVLLKYTDLGLFAIAGVSVVTAIIRNLVFTFPYAAYCVKIKWNSFYIVALRTTLSVGTMCVLFTVIKGFFSPHGWFELIVVAGFCAVIGILLNLLILFNKTERMQLIKSVLKKIRR